MTYELSLKDYFGNPWTEIFFPSFFSLLLEGVPFLLFGACLSSLLETFEISKKLKDRLPRSPINSVLASIGLGFCLPICECSSLPVARSFLRNGIAPACAAGFLFSGALLNPITLFTTFVAFQGRSPIEMTFWRAGLGLIIILILTAWISRLPNEVALTTSDSNHDHDHGAGSGKLRRWANGVIHDFIDILPFFIAGSAAATFFRDGLDWKSFHVILSDSFWGPVAGIGMAQLFCLCSTTDAFIIAAFSTIPAATQLAFLVAGPLFDLRLIFFYRALFSTRLIRDIWILVTLGTLLLIWGRTWLL